MYTNKSRSSSRSSSKRKLEKGETEDVSGVAPVKQYKYGESLSAARAKQHDNLSSTTRGARVNQNNCGESASRGVSYGEHLNSRAGVAKQSSYSDHQRTAPKQHSYGDNLNPSARAASVETHSYDNTSNSSSRAAPSSHHNYGDILNAANKHHNNAHHSNHREGSGVGEGSTKPYMFSNQYSYENMCPPPLSNQFNYGDNEGPMQQYEYEPDNSQVMHHQVPSYHPGLGHYGQHNGMGGQGRGWNQRGRPPMQGFQGSQWPPLGPPPRPPLRPPLGPPLRPSLRPPPRPPLRHPPRPSLRPIHPHMRHPGHITPLLPPFGHPPPPGCYYVPPPLPLFGHQGNQHEGPNQGGHKMGSYQKSKNKKRQEDAKCGDTNVVPPKVKGGVLLSPDNKPIKSRKKDVLPTFPSRPWNREDAEKALKVEVDTTLNLKNESLIIRFPDPELSRDIVKTYHPGIQNVHFQVPSGPRYCFVQLAPDANTKKVIRILENVKFGSGHLSVEKKSTKQEEEASPESIDPYTLYIGNLPTNVNIQTVKEKFPDAARVDVGFAQRMRFTRYAFIRFNSVDDAIKAYIENHNLVLDSRSIIVRFRRQKGQIDLPGESKQQQPVKVNVRTADTKTKKDDNKSDITKKDSKDEDDECDKDDEEEDEEEEDNFDDDDDDDDEEGEAEDDDDDDEEEDASRKPLEDDDDEDDDPIGGPTLPPDDDDEDDDNIFRELDAQLGGYDGFPFNFN